MRKIDADSVASLYTISESAIAGVFEIALDGETGDAATEPKSCSGTKAEISICRAAHCIVKVPKTKIPAHWRKRRAIRTGYLAS